METYVIVIIAVVLLMSLSFGSYSMGMFGSDADASSCDEPAPAKPAYVARYQLNEFSCRDPINVPGGVFRGTLEKCEAACDNVLACVGFDRRVDVTDDQEAFCYLQMSHCNENSAERQLSPDQDGPKWKRHMKP